MDDLIVLFSFSCSKMHWNKQAKKRTSYCHFHPYIPDLAGSYLHILIKSAENSSSRVVQKGTRIRQFRKTA